MWNIRPIKKDGKWGFINTDGKIICEPKYERVLHSDSLYAVVVKDGKAGVINSKLETIIDFEFEEIKIQSETEFALYRDGYWNIVDILKAKLVTLSFSSQNISKFTKERYQLKSNGYCTLVDLKGDTIIHIECDNILNENLYYKATYDSLFNLYSKSGRLLIDSIKWEKYEGDSLIVFRKDSTLGGVELSGKISIEPLWESYSYCGKMIKLNADSVTFSLYSKPLHKIATKNYKGKAEYLGNNYIKINTGNRIIVINNTGKEILNIECERIKYHSYGFFMVVKNGKLGAFNLKGKQIFDFKYSQIGFLNRYIVELSVGTKTAIARLDGRIVQKPGYYSAVMNDNILKLYATNKLHILVFDENWRLVEKNSFGNFGTITLNNRVFSKDAYNVLGQTINQTGSSGSNTRNISQQNSGGNANNRNIEYDLWFFDKKMELWGLNDSLGNKKLPPMFKDITVFDDFTKIYYEDNRKRNQIFQGLVRHKNLTKFNMPEFRSINTDNFKHQGFAMAIQKNRLCAGINKDGEKLFKNVRYLDDFKEGLARFCQFGYLQRCSPNHNMALLCTESTGPFGKDYSGQSMYFRRAKWGFIDKNGNIVIPPRFEYVKQFSFGVAPVRADEKWGLIDTSGIEVMPYKYDDISLISGLDSLFLIKLNSKRMGLIDSEGNIKTGCEYDEIGLFLCGMAKVRINKKWGFIDLNGKLVIPCIYDIVRDFSENRAAVCTNYRWGIVDRGGKTIIKPVHIRLGDFSENACWITGKRWYQYVDTTGKVIINEEYQKCGDFKNGFALVRKDGQKFLIDKQGKRRTHDKLRKISEVFDEKYIIVAKKKKYALHTVNGEKLTGYSYRKIEPFNDGLAVVYNRRKYGYIDTTGNIVIPPQGFKGRKIIKSKSKIRYITVDNGQKYRRWDGYIYSNKDTIKYSSGDWYLSTFKHQRGVLTHLEKHIAHFITDKYFRLNHLSYSEIKGIYNDFIIARRHLKLALIDHFANEITPFEFSHLEYLGENRCAYSLPYTYGIANAKGKILLEPIYRHVNFTGDEIFKVEYASKIGYIKQNGEWLWKPAE